MADRNSLYSVQLDVAHYLLVHHGNIEKGEEKRRKRRAYFLQH